MIGIYVLVRAILCKAADIIEQKGWHAGHFEPYKGILSYCRELLPLPSYRWESRSMVHAVRDAELATTSGLAIGVGDAVRKCLTSELNDNDIDSWADAPGRTQEQVITALRSAATRCEEKR